MSDLSRLRWELEAYILISQGVPVIEVDDDGLTIDWNKKK